MSNQNTPINNNLLKVEKKFNDDGTPKKDAISILIKKKIIDDVQAGLKYDLIKEKYGLKNKYFFIFAIDLFYIFLNKFN